MQIGDITAYGTYLGTLGGQDHYFGSGQTDPNGNQLVNKVWEMEVGVMEWLETTIKRNKSEKFETLYQKLLQ